MAGRRDANLRSGDRAEHRGIELLRDFACVAPVPREEDLGIDAVATLLRRDGRTLAATGSFFVQFKSASVAHIDLVGDDPDWVFGLRLPLFYGWVDRAADTVALYSSDAIVPVSCLPHRVSGERRTLRLIPGLGPLLGGERRSEFAPRTTPIAKREDGGLDVYLGDPVAKWSRSDAAQVDLKEQITAVLEEWAGVAQRAVEYRRFGVFLRMVWETNRPPREIPPLTVVEGRVIAPNLTRLLPTFRAIEAQARDHATPSEQAAISKVREFLTRVGAKEPWET